MQMTSILKCNRFIVWHNVNFIFIWMLSCDLLSRNQLVALYNMVITEEEIQEKKTEKKVKPDVRMSCT